MTFHLNETEAANIVGWDLMYAMREALDDQPDFEIEIEEDGSRTFSLSVQNDTHKLTAYSNWGAQYFGEDYKEGDEDDFPWLENGYSYTTQKI